MNKESRQQLSKSMKEVWAKKRLKILKARVPSKAEKELNSLKMKKHYLEHPEHKKAISLAQKNKWVRLKAADEYCRKANINLELI